MDDFIVVGVTFVLPFLQIDDLQLNLDKERASVIALEKKQKKFDQVCLLSNGKRGLRFKCWSF